MRGKLIKRAAEEGGKLSGSKIAPSTKATLAEMRRLLDDRKSTSDAARIAHMNGFGKSAIANRALWYAHRKHDLSE